MTVYVSVAQGHVAWLAALWLACWPTSHSGAMLVVGALQRAEILSLEVHTAWGRLYGARAGRS